jgi:hypothetical protein
MLCPTQILLKENPNLDQVIKNEGGAHVMSFNESLQTHTKLRNLLQSLTPGSLDKGRI